MWRAAGPPGGRARKGEVGQSLVEFALGLLVLVLLILGIVDFGRAVFARSAVASAAREGARFAIVNVRVDATEADKAAIEPQIVDAASAKLAGLDEGALQVSVTYPTTREVEVWVTYTYHAITPLLGDIIEGGGGGIVLSGHSKMYIERKD